MKNKLIALLAASAVALTFTACGSKDSTDKGADSNADTSVKADDNKDTAGIEEKPAGEPNVLTQGPLKIDVVYFQAIDMEKGTSMMPPAAESDMHFEVDVETTDEAKDFGYKPGDFLPYLNINATMTNTDTGEKIEQGAMMPMIAADGPHYGNNIKLPAGNYDVTLTVASPGDKFMLHTGKDSSAVPGHFWTEPLVFEFHGWQWDGQQL